MNISQPCTYAKVTQAAAATVKSIRGEVYAILVISSTAATVTVRDGGASGTIVFSKAALTAGEVIHFGGCGILCKSDIYVEVGGTGEVTVLYI